MKVGNEGITCIHGHLGIDAMLYIHYLFGSFRSFVIDMTGADAYGFFLLAELGLFVRTGTRYQMCIPSESITPELVAAAIERLLSTEDPDDGVHPRAYHQMYAEG
jgi:hypothetical protein